MTGKGEVTKPRVAQDEVIWTSLLDGRYTVAVRRLAHYKGELTICDESKVLNRQEVSLMFDARFGPDIDDVRCWEFLAVKFVDNQSPSS